MSSADADSTVGAGSAGSTTAALSQGTATIGSSNRKGSTVLLNQPIVIDSGTATIKAGFAGGSKPKVCSYVQCAYLTVIKVNAVMNTYR